jgi:tetratricopeptide (TPR) repeat protein
VLKTQTEIAYAVAYALKVRLLSDVATKIELGGTRNPAALDAYLRGRTATATAFSAEDYQRVIAVYTEAIRLDPNFAVAFANRSMVLSDYTDVASGAAIRDAYDKENSDALKAIALAPDLAEGHLALAAYFANVLDFLRADEEYERVLALAPGSARVLRGYSLFAVAMGRTDAGITAARRALILDPLNSDSQGFLASSLYFGGHYKEAVETFQNGIAFEPENPAEYGYQGLAYYAEGDFQRARATCETKRDDFYAQLCLAITYDKLGRHAEAERVLAKTKARTGRDWAYKHAQIYAQWGNNPQALNWLESALRLREGNLRFLKTDPLLAPLRQEPRFQAIERELKFPQLSGKAIQ